MKDKQIEDILGKWFKDPVDKPCPYCEARKEIQSLYLQDIKRLSTWVIGKRAKLQEKKEVHTKAKPHDVQALAVLGGKIKALQQVIDKLKGEEERLGGCQS